LEYRRSDGTEVAPNQQANIYFSMERMRIMNSIQAFFVHKRFMSVVKRVDFVSDRMLYIIVRGRWCDIIVLIVHAPTEDKIDDMKCSFYGQLERVFDKLPKYNIKNF
jgi:hypothetical protein